MKKVFLTVLFMSLLLSSNLMAQTGGHFGLKTGYNIGTQYGSTSSDTSSEVDSSARHGFTGGLLIYFPVTDSFGIQQEFLYTTKGSRQEVSMNDLGITINSEYNMNYFELPVVVRYNFANIYNVGIYGNAGFAFSMMLNGDYSTDITDPAGNVIPVADSEDLDELD